MQGSAAQKARGPLLNLVMQLRKCCNHPTSFPMWKIEVYRLWGNT